MSNAKCRRSKQILTFRPVGDRRVCREVGRPASAFLSGDELGIV